MIFDHIAQNENMYGKAHDAGKLGIIGHSILFKLMTTNKSYWNEIFDDKNHECYKLLPPDDYNAMIMNCEFYPL